MDNQRLIINIIFLTVLLIILLTLISKKNPLENFTPGIFGTDIYTLPRLYLNQTKCTPENNCFPGSYARTQIYQNVCEPNHGLLRQKIPLDDTCQRTLSDYMATPQHYYVCDVDNHLQRKCRWIKKKNLFQDDKYTTRPYY